ncbi:hypothetical protein FOCC_FOCC001479 [Frankliniella occidentalis]|nr:hypothetical protein FOCC_FOCC001479 [Frankliniella occidentalis]
MKVKVISRNPDEYLRETKRDIHKVQRNYDPALHPLEAPREYARAMNSVKLERIFAKPFLGNLDGHRDGVSCLAKHPETLSFLASGAYDGEIKFWDLPQRICKRSFQAHDGCVRGLTFTPDGKNMLSMGDDKTIKTWSMENEQEDPTNTILSKTVLLSLSHQRSQNQFVTCGEVCQLWEHGRNEPIRSYQWGVDSLHHVSFNQVETNLLGKYFSACASDRSVILYDTRDSGPVRKVVMKLKANSVCWNPMEAFNFTVANEDFNLYTFDVRQMRVPANVHMDHVGAVVSVDYSPTGKEFVSGSYDRTVRIYEAHKGHSREVYHTKRMQKLSVVSWSLDNKYIMSGSDEMNIRVWKARAAEKLGALKPREKAALNYHQALRTKFAQHPQIKRIARHRHVPKHIYNAQKEQHAMRDKAKRKEGNVRKHSKKGAVPFVPERKKHVIREHE